MMMTSNEGIEDLTTRYKGERNSNNENSTCFPLRLMVYFNVTVIRWHQEILPCL